MKNSADLLTNLRSEKLENSILPTPLQRLNNLSRIFNVNIWCKRDDLTGFAFGGNKTRKLDYLTAEAMKSKHDSLVCVGGIQSNFCRIASAYGAFSGLKVFCVLGGGKEPKKYTGNLMLMKMFNADISYVASSDWGDWEREAINLTKKLERKGLTPYYMPIGGSNTTGAVAYIDCFDEIIQFSKTKKVKFDCIIHATGSAGTQTGTVLGKEKNKWKGDLIGVAVTKDKNLLYNEVFSLALQTSRKYKLNFNPFDIKVDDRFIGKCYGDVTKESREAVNLFASNEGILLDYVYSGKAASALMYYCRKKYFNSDNNVLFIHTGGNAAIFK